VRVASGDVNGDGRVDIITGSGPGAGPEVKVFDGITLSILQSFLAYAPEFQGGVFVAAGDINSDGLAEIVTGADAGGAPHVKIFDGSTESELQSFLAFAPTFQGGVRVAVGDVDADGDLDIVTGSGTAGGPHVKVFDGSTGNELRSFDAFDPEFTSGVFASAFAPSPKRNIQLPSGGGTFEVTVESGDLVVRDGDGNVVTRTPLEGLHELQLVGSPDDDDTFRIDLVNLPLDVFVDGGTGGNDSLEVFGGSVDVATHLLDNRNDGTLQLDGRTIRYTGLEPVDMSDVTVADWVFQMPDLSDDAVLENVGNPIDGLIQLRSLNGTFESTLFRIPTASLTIDGGGGDDRIDGSGMAAVMGLHIALFGGDGNDLLTGTVNADLLVGESGSDTLSGLGGNDSLFGGAGVDFLNGGAGDDRLRGQGAGGDRLSGGPGDDDLDGGPGNDRVVEDANVDFTATNNSLTGLGNDVLTGIELLTLSGGVSGNRIDASGFSGDMVLIGRSGDDLLIGGSGNDRINGGAGRDTLIGNDGHDRLRGQGSTGDRLSGGQGNDTLDGGAGNDLLFEEGNVNFSLNDTLLTGLGTDRVIDIERASLRGGISDNRIDASGFSGSVSLLGFAGDDTLIGGASADQLRGGAGRDFLRGGPGNDGLFGQGGSGDDLDGNTGADTLDGGAGRDHIRPDDIDLVIDDALDVLHVM
jgi:Ca2+-binding RTX toxin-like protein